MDSGSIIIGAIIGALAVIIIRDYLEKSKIASAPAPAMDAYVAVQHIDALVSRPGITSQEAYNSIPTAAIKGLVKEGEISFI